MTGKRKSQHSAHTIEGLTIKLLLLNEVKDLSLDSYRPGENGASRCNHLCPVPPAPLGGIPTEPWEAEGGPQGARGWHIPRKGPVVLPTGLPPAPGSWEPSMGGSYR